MNKKGLVARELILWIIAIVVLLVVLGYMLGLGEKMTGLIGRIGDLLRLGN